VAVVGLVPAAGHARRLQPLRGSKEVYPVLGRPVMDYLVERMRAAGCAEVRVVTRRDKADVAAHAAALGATVVFAEPANVSESFRAGMALLDRADIVLLGFPDTLWAPLDGYRTLVAAIEDGADVALGLFEIPAEDLTRSDVIVFGADGGIAGIAVKPAVPPSTWIWGCAAARVSALEGLERAEEPGVFVDDLCRRGRDVRGLTLGSVWLDVGTVTTLARADSFAASLADDA
jgi:dTDP-glucose pyrophosphorylase